MVNSFASSFTLSRVPATTSPLCPVVAGLSSEPFKVQSRKDLAASLGPSSQRQLIPTIYTHTEIKILFNVMYPEKNSTVEGLKALRKVKSSHLLYPSSSLSSPPSPTL